MSKIIYFHFDGNYYAGDHIDIHDNQSVNIFQGQQSPVTSSTTRTATAEDVTQVDPVAEDIPLFKFIHPSVITEQDKQQIHEEVKNLVTQFPLPEICRYLRQMRKEQRVYLNVKPEAMFAELHRLGMPSESTHGYSYKNFMNYFNIND